MQCHSINNLKFITMKNYKTFSLSLLVMMFLSSSVSFAQEEEAESSSNFDVGLDIYSSYVWRGSKFGEGPAFQPWVSFAVGGLEIGAWGSVCVGPTEAAEMDLYVSYGFDFGLSLGLTDYYYPGSKYFEYSDSAGSHGFELNVGYEIGGFSIAANYMLNEAGGAGTDGGDLYFELGYSFENVSLFAGAGNGWHTVEDGVEDPKPDGTFDDVFNVVNVGLSTGKDIKITDSFSLPLSGSVILNPYTEQFFIVVGLSL